IHPRPARRQQADRVPLRSPQDHRDADRASGILLHPGDAERLYDARGDRSIRGSDGRSDQERTPNSLSADCVMRIAEYQGELATQATIRKGPPLPPPIFIGSATMNAPVFGSCSRFATFSNAGMSAAKRTWWVS